MEIRALPEPLLYFPFEYTEEPLESPSVQQSSGGCTLCDLIESLKDAVYSLVDEFAFTLTVPIKGKMQFAFLPIQISQYPSMPKLQLS